MRVPEGLQWPIPLVVGEHSVIVTSGGNGLRRVVSAFRMVAFDGGPPLFESKMLSADPAISPAGENAIISFPTPFVRTHRASPHAPFLAGSPSNRAKGVGVHAVTDSNGQVVNILEIKFTTASLAVDD